MIDAATWIAQTLDLHAPDIGAIPAALRPPDLDAGYALQDRVTALMSSRGRGATIGWKVGSTTASMQRLLGVPSRRPRGLVRERRRTPRSMRPKATGSP